MHAYTHTHTRAHMHTCTHAHTRTHPHTHNSQLRACVRTRTHTRICTHTHSHTHTHTHTNMRTQLTAEGMLPFLDLVLVPLYRLSEAKSSHTFSQGARQGRVVDEEAVALAVGQRSSTPLRCYYYWPVQSLSGRIVKRVWSMVKRVWSRGSSGATAVGAGTSTTHLC
jgi:hypothetical protein